MHRPLFSIVTVCYNSERTIGRTLESVAAQTCPDYEYWVIDGASTDGTLRIVEQHAPAFGERLHVVSEPDRGIYDAFNKGISRAEGHFIWLVNSDDYLAPDALSALRDVALAHKGQNVVIEGRTREEKADGTFVLSPLSTPESRRRRYRRCLLGITHPSSVFSREVYEEVGLYDAHYYIVGDKDLFVRAMAFGTLFVTLDHTLTTMSFGGISTRLDHGRWLADQWYAARKFSRSLCGAIGIFLPIYTMYLRRRFRGLCRRLCRR